MPLPSSSWVLAASCAASLAAVPASAATASLVRDINALAAGGLPQGKGAQQLVPLGARVLFVGSEPSSGQEVWASDGTPHGTELLADVCPGACSPVVQMLGATAHFAFFFAATPEGERLWRSDGTRGGTLPLLDVQPSVHLPFAASAVTPAGLYFVHCPDGDCELWTSDGTAAGTRAITDLHEQGIDAPPDELTPLDNTLFFAAPSPDGRAVWRTTGSEAGTVRLGAFPGSRRPRLLTIAGGRLFFAAERDGAELWMSDGTPAGTRAVTDFAPPDPFATTSFLEAAGDAVYFAADGGPPGGGLWRGDGTAAGTRRVSDFVPSEVAFGAAGIEPIGDRLLFLDTREGDLGYVLWTSGGTPSSTRPLAGCQSICPEIVVRTPLLRLGGAVFFFARDPSAGTSALWRSDGTGAGTRKVRDLCVGDCGPDERQIAQAGGRLYFVAGSPPHHYRLWSSDGTATGTRPLLPVGSFPFGDAQVLEAVLAGDRTFFGANDGTHGAQLWTAGAAGAAERVSTFALGEPSANPVGLAPFRDGVLFAACDGLAAGFWASGGTAGTQPLPSPVAPCGGEWLYHDPVVLGDGAFALLREAGATAAQLWRLDDGGGPAQLTLFSTAGTLSAASAESLIVHQGKLTFAVSAANGWSLWTSDGTFDGTVELLDLPAGVGDVTDLTSLDGELYFVARHTPAPTGGQVWRSDGTAAGTQRLTDFDAQAFPGPPRFTRLGSRVYFLADTDHAPGAEVWSTDGTASGTAPLVPHAAGARAEAAQGLVAFAGALYFFGDAGLWRSDGTAGGTVLLRKVAPSTQLSLAPPPPTPAGGRLFFTADDGESGVELWATDGTAGGTVPVKDLRPGPGSSFPRGLTAAEGKLFFTATDGVHGFELWESDGTAAGTRMVHDLAPGALSSDPGEPTPAGGRLFFAADDGVWGRELWSVPLAPGLPSCTASATAVCLGGRYRVEARWRDFAGRGGAGQALALTADTGAFWFFGAGNVEVVVKVLDGRGVNGHAWVFYGALSSVEYTLTVTDTATGAARRYVNPAGRLGSVADTRAFGPLGATPSSLSFGPTAPPAPAAAVVAGTRSVAAAAAPCAPSATRLCLNGGRFAVEARWAAQGQDGAGTAVPLGADTGWFGFFGAGDVAVLVKVLDGRGVNGKFWIFYGALSDVAYTLTVTDTQTGMVRSYENPQGRLAGAADTGAF